VEFNLLALFVSFTHVRYHNIYNKMIIFRFQKNSGNVLPNWAPTNFPRKICLRDMWSGCNEQHGTWGKTTPSYVIA